MADVETNNDVVDTTEENDVVDTTSDSSEYTPKDEYTYDEVLELESKLRKAEEARKKAEAALVEKKRAEKEAKKQKEVAPTASGDFVTKQDLELERFLNKNPDMEEYKDELVSYVSKGISLKEAAILVENEPSIQNRKKINKMNITASEGAVRSTVFTKDQLAKMNQNDYNRAMDLLSSGKASIR